MSPEEGALCSDKGKCTPMSKKKKNFKNSMDVRCIRYHLEALVYVFNKRKIEADEFKRNILRIRPFKSGNYRPTEILLLGIKNNKRN